MSRCVAVTLLLSSAVLPPACALVTDFDVTLDDGAAGSDMGQGGTADGGSGGTGGSGGSGGSGGAADMCVPIAPAAAPDCADVPPCNGAGGGGGGGGCGVLMAVDTKPGPLAGDAASIVVGSPDELRRIPKPGCEGQVVAFSMPEYQPNFMAFYDDALFWSRNDMAGLVYGLLRCDPEDCARTVSVVAPSAGGGDKYNGHTLGPDGSVYALRIDGPVMRLSAHGCSLEEVAVDPAAETDTPLLHTIAAVGDLLLWSRHAKASNLNNSGAVVRLDLSSGLPYEPVDITASNLHAVLGAASDGTYFYFRKNYELLSRVPVAGGVVEDAPASGLTANGHGPISLHEGHVYITAFENGLPVVARISVSTFDALEVVARAPAGLTVQTGMWVDDSGIFWNLGSDGISAELWAFPM